MFHNEPWEKPVHMPDMTPQMEYCYDGFVYVLREDGAEIVGYRARWRTVRIPVRLDGHLVVSIAGGAFMGNDAMCDLIIPGTVRHIGDYAFYRCPALQQAILLEGVETIGQCAFDACGMMGNVYTPRTIRQVGDNAFMDTARLRIMGSPDSAVQAYCDRNGLLLVPHTQDQNAE